MTAHVETTERRKFTRVPFEASVSLRNPSGTWTGKLKDISLNGILVSRPHHWTQVSDNDFLIEIHPAENAFSIRMEASLAHTENNSIGLKCHHIDIDSASHLRRLVELNIGDNSILNREFLALVENVA